MTIANTVKSISENRLATYRERLKLRTDGDCLGLYIWNKKLCGVFLPVLQLLEVSLRNAIHLGYLEHRKDVLLAEGKAEEEIAGAIDRAWFKTFFDLHKTEYAESWRQIEQAEITLQKMNRPNDIDQIIAKLSYGFWSHLCSEAHDDANPDSLQLWPAIQDHVFLGARKSTGFVTMKEIRDLLVQINHIRNRIAHHEPIWHSSQLYDLEGFVNKVINDFKKCLKVIGWINPSNLKTLTIMQSADELAYLCRLQTIDEYRQRGNDLASAEALDADKWANACLLADRHDGVVISVGRSTVIKSLKDKKTFVLDVFGKWEGQLALQLQKDEHVNFLPARKVAKNSTTLLARHVKRGHTTVHADKLEAAEMPSSNQA